MKKQKSLKQRLQYLKYRLKFNLLPRLKITSDFPTHIDIETTNYCNLDCVMCGRSLMSEGMGLMNWGTFVKILKECEKEHCPSIKLNWRGEPLIHPLIAEMIGVAKKEAGIFQVQLNTNAQLLTKDKTDKICKAGLDRIIISADGITKETYEKIRLNASWEKLINNIRYLQILSPRPIIRIQTCELPQNEKEIGDFEGFWSKYADEVRIWQSFDPLKRKSKLYRRKKKRNCPQLWQRLVVSWNGNIHSCCVDWNSRGILGNIKDMTLKEAWHSAQERYLRFLHKNKIAGIVEPCKNCDNFIV